MRPTTQDFPHVSDQSVHRTIGHIHAATHAQQVAATAADAHLWLCKFNGNVNDLSIQISTAIAADESMAYVIKKNGSSVMASALTITDKAAKSTIPIKSYLTDAGKSFVAGDVYTVSRTYTAGGSPTMTHNDVTLEPTTYPGAA